MRFIRRVFQLLLLSCGLLVALVGDLQPLGAAPTFAWPELVREEFLTDLEQPVQITHAGDGSGRLFVVERPGRIRVAVDGVLVPEPFLDIRERVATTGECGLLSVAFPHDFAERGLFFVYYSHNTAELGDLAPPEVPGEPNGGCDSVIASFQVTDDPNTADPASEVQLLAINQPYDNHNGGQIAFGPDGMLYIGLGDGGGGGDPHNLAQNPASLLGKLLRIQTDDSGYSVPADNPFVGDPAYRPEIWSLGLRNPWRFSFDQGTGDLYIADVGQAAYEEINFQFAANPGGNNYGWDEMEGLHCYPADANCDPGSFVTPVVEYDHGEGQSISGGFVYRGLTYPRMHGVYFYADFANGRIWGLRRPASGWETALLAETGRTYGFVGFGEDADGEIYLVDIGGSIYRLSDTLSASDLPLRLFLPHVQH